MVDDTLPLTLRIPRATLAGLDEWAKALNTGRRGPKLSRNDLIRMTLEWAVEERPDVEAPPRERGAPGFGSPPPPAEPDPDVAQELRREDVERMARERGTIAPHEVAGPLARKQTPEEIEAENEMLRRAEKNGKEKLEAQKAGEKQERQQVAKEQKAKADRERDK